MGKSAVALGDVPEFYVQGLSHIEVMGSVARHVLFTERIVSGKVIRVPTVHIIMPNSAVAIGIQKVLQALPRNNETETIQRLAFGVKAH